MESFQNYIISSDLHEMFNDNVAEFTNKYNSVLSQLLNKHSPLKKCTVTVHPRMPWITETTKKQETEKRKAMRKWQKDWWYTRKFTQSS